jgi:hypothetical protein
MHLTGIPFEEANDYLANYKNSNINSTVGNYFSPASLEHYISTIFPSVIDKQPEKPESYEWEASVQLGVDADDKLIILFMPVLVKEQPAENEPRVLTAITHPEFFHTAVVDINDRPCFAFNKGTIWP